MKFSISVAALSAILKQCSRVAGRKTNEATSHVLIDVRDGELSVSAQNGSQQIVRRTRTATLLIEQDGAICASAQKLDQIAAALPPGKDVKLALTDDKLVLTCGRSRFSLATLDVDSFPLITVSEPISTFSIDSEALRDAGRSVAFCCGRDDVRQFLNGMLVSIKDGQAHLVGSDGHRMGVHRIEGVTAPDTAVIIPTAIVDDFLAFSSDSQTCIRLYQNLISVVSASGEFYSKLIDGNYPDFNRLIKPHAAPTRLTISRTELLSATQRVSLLSDERTAGIRIALNESEVVLRSMSQDNGAEEVVTASLTGNSFEVGFNARYLVEILKAVPDEKVVFEFDGASGAVHVMGEAPHTNYVLMPMRT